MRAGASACEHNVMRNFGRNFALCGAAQVRAGGRGRAPHCNGGHGALQCVSAVDTSLELLLRAWCAYFRKTWGRGRGCWNGWNTDTDTGTYQMRCNPTAASLGGWEHWQTMRGARMVDCTNCSSMCAKLNCAMFNKPIKYLQK